MDSRTWALKLEPGHVYAITPRHGPLKITNAATALKVEDKYARSSLELGYIPAGLTEPEKCTIVSLTVGFFDHAKMEIPLERSKKITLEVIGPNAIDIMGVLSVEKIIKGPAVEVKTYRSGSNVLGVARPGRALTRQASTTEGELSAAPLKRKNPPNPQKGGAATKKSRVVTTYIPESGSASKADPRARIGSSATAAKATTKAASNSSAKAASTSKTTPKASK